MNQQPGRCLLLAAAALLLSHSQAWCTSTTYTWDPRKTGTGSDGSGSWQGPGTGAATNFSTGTTDVAYPGGTDTSTAGNTIFFGDNDSSDTSSPAAGIVTLAGATYMTKSAYVVRLAPLAANVTTGYVFNGATGYSISVAAIGANAGTSGTPITSTFNVPVLLNALNFNSPNNTIAFTAGSTTFGANSFNFTGNTPGDGASGTALLTAGTYNLGTQIDIGAATTGGWHWRRAGEQRRHDANHCGRPRRGRLQYGHDQRHQLHGGSYD